MFLLKCREDNYVSKRPEKKLTLCQIYSRLDEQKGNDLRPNDLIIGLSVECNKEVK